MPLQVTPDGEVVELDKGIWVIPSIPQLSLTNPIARVVKSGTVASQEPISVEIVVDKSAAISAQAVGAQTGSWGASKSKVKTNSALALLPKRAQTKFSSISMVYSNIAFASIQVKSSG